MSTANTIISSETAPVLLITGMHRNGTSIVTKALSTLGVNLGDPLVPADSGNPTGYWEHKEAVSINENILKWLKIYWDQPLISSSAQYQLPEHLITRGSNFLEANASKALPFAFKDPRSARLLPFWNEAAKRTKQPIKLQHLLVLRNPLDSARSLARRNGISVERGLALWVEHMLAFSTHTDWDTTLIVQYEDLLKDPKNTLCSLQKRLAIPYADSSTNNPHSNFEKSIEHNRENFIANFLDKTNLATVSSIIDLEEYSSAIPLLIPLYQVLIEGVSSPMTSDSRRWFSACWSGYGLGESVSKGISTTAIPSLPKKETQKNSTTTQASVCLQLYYDGGKGFNEEEKLHQMVPQGTITASFELPSTDITRIRLDTGDVPCVCRIEEIWGEVASQKEQLSLVHHTALSIYNEVYLFGDDPQLEFNVSPKTNVVSVKFEYIELPHINSKNIVQQSHQLIAQLLALSSSNKFELAQAKSESQRLSIKNDALINTASLHTQKILSLSEQIKKQKDQFSSEVDAVSELYEKQINTFRKHINELEKQVAVKNSTTAHQRATLKKVTKSSTELQNTLIRLQHENESLCIALDEIKDSITWRAARRVLQPLENFSWFKKLYTKLTYNKGDRKVTAISFPHTAPETPKSLRKELCVVIPVYNGKEALIKLFETLQQSHPVKEAYLTFVVIDDASPDNTMKELLSSHPFCLRNDVTCLYNDTNLGFTGTANRGIKFAPGADIVLLNSDTEVWSKSFHILQDVAYRDEHIASVTPLTNKGSIASILNWPDGSDSVYQVPAQDIASIVESTGIATPFIQAPTGVGFCMYMTRKALNEVGDLDQKTFGKGYGEENDWSQRAIKKGFQNILCTETYVHHAETQSFTSEKKRLALKTNLKKLNKKHPNYAASVEKYINCNPLEIERHTLLWNILGRSKHYAQRKTIIQVLHKSPMSHLGGTELHVRTLTYGLLQDKNIEVVWLTPDHNGITLTLLVSPFETVFTMAIPAQYVDSFLPKILTRADLLHIHHLHGFTEKAIEVLKDWVNCSKIFTAHDFNCVCPSWNLLKNGAYCNPHETVECNSCEYKDQMYEQRSLYTQLFKSCDQIITPSSSTADIIKRIFSDNINCLDDKIKTLPHMLPIPVSKNIHKQDTVKRIIFLGGLTESKGAKLLFKAFNHLIKHGVTCEIWGDSPYSIPQNITLRRYASREELQKMANEFQVDIVCIPSIWPETFCYTAYEALCIIKAPIVCGPYGNPADVVQKHNVGKTMRDCSSEELVVQIEAIAANYIFYQQSVNSFNPEMLTNDYAQKYCSIFTQFLI